MGVINAIKELPFSKVAFIASAVAASYSSFCAVRSKKENAKSGLGLTHAIHSCGGPKNSSLMNQQEQESKIATEFSIASPAEGVSTFKRWSF